MSAPDLDVRQVARLARVALNDEEVAMFQSQLGRILEHIEHLKKLDVSGVEPTAHTYPVFNVLREDVPGASLEQKAALAIAPRSANNLFVVPRVLE